MTVRGMAMAAMAALLVMGPVIAAGLAPANEAELGRAVYSNCAGCHGDAGQGGFAPAFVGNANIREDQAAIVHVVSGSVNMPPFGDQLSDAEIAAVLNHVRNSWGNKAAPIRPADVAAVEKLMTGQ